jgi:ABC-type antimicrobial peptide transport system permease subunit
MKSIGTLLDTIFDFFMAQSVIMLLSSIALGLAFGTILYMAGMIWLSSVVPSLQFTNTFPVIQIAVLALVLVFAGYLSAQKPIYDTVQESPSKALNPDVGSKVQVSGFLDSFGLPFRIATKGTGRRLRGTRRTVLSIFLSFTIASVLWIGGGVVHTTSSTYVTRSMGTNIVAVGSSDMLDSYYESYSLYGEPLNDSFSYLENEDILPDSLVSDITDILGVIQVESRLVVYSDVEAKRVTIFNEETQNYDIIGEDRLGSVVLIGINWDSTISNWYYEGRIPENDGQVWIGGRMSSELFEDPLIQPLEVNGINHEVKAQAFDILNGGMMALMDISLIQSYFGVSGSNLLLVQLDDYDDALISQIDVLAESYGFDIFRQQDLLETNLETISAIWALLNPLAIVTLVSAFLSLMNYLLVSVFGRLRDYIIMRSVGAKPSFLAKVMIAEGLEVGLRAGIPALIVGTLLSIYSLIPEAAVPSLAYLPVTIIAVLATMISVILLASIPTYVFFATRTDLRVSEFSS